MKIRFLAGIAALALAGCASVKVSRTAAWPQPPAAGTTYAFGSLSTDAASYRKAVAQELSRKSWSETPARQATYLVTFQYRIDAVSAETVRTPVFATSSVGGPTMTQGILVQNGEGDASYAGTRWRTTPVTATVAERQKEYRGTVSVEIINRATRAVAYRATATQVDMEADPGAVVPNLLQAIFKHFP